MTDGDRNVLSRLLDKVTAHPWIIIVGAALLTIPALDRLVDLDTLSLKLAVDPSMAALLPRDGEALEVFEHTRKRFATDDVLFVAWLADDLFTPKRLAGLKRLTRRIERLPGVVKVESLASALNIKAQREVTTIDPFLRELPADQTAALHARDDALANPLFTGQLVSKDGRGALLAVHFDPALSTRTLIDRVNRIATASRAEAGGAQQFLSGPLFVRLEFSRVLLRDLYLIMPIAMLGTLPVAGLGFRTLRGVLTPLIANIVALLGTLACFAAAGHTLNFVTVILPPVIYVVGFAYAIHVVSNFDRHFLGGLDRTAATKAALSDVVIPLTLTAVTTAVGFASLALSNIDSIRLFGLYAALGVILAWAAALTVVPAGLVILPARQRFGARQDWLSGLAPRLTRFDLRHQRLFLIGGAVLAVASLAAATRMEVSTEVLHNFSQTSPVRQNFERIGSVFAGTVPIRILIDSERPDTFKDPASLRLIADLQTWLNAQPEIGGAYSLVDYIGILHRAIVPEAASNEPIPASSRLTNHLLLLGGGDDLKRFTDPSFSSALVHVRATTFSTAKLLDLIARIEARLDKLPTDLRGQVTGTSYLIAQTVDDITRGQITSLAAALGVIYVVLAILFRSFRTGSLALVPNALPILVYFGILGLSPITLNITTSLVATAVLGIAVDDSIHFFSRYRTEARRTGSRRRGVEAALAALIRPVTLTTAALCVGFLAVTTGDLQSQVEFGLLAAVTLFVAWVLDLTFTPALRAGSRLHAKSVSD